MRWPVSQPALGVAGVLLVAKALVLARAGVAIGPESALVFVWQDVAVALAALAAIAALAEMSPDLISGRSTQIRIWAAYALFVTYVAVNVVVTDVLGSPLTWPMMRAAGGPLADSFAYYATLHSLWPVGVVLLTAVVMPVLARRVRHLSAGTLGGLLVVVAAGMALAPRVDTRGLDRNAVTALVSWPRVSAAEVLSSNWRTSPFESVGPGLEHLRGTARGMNVVLVILESTAAQYLGAYGDAEDPMPALTRLSQSSVVFDAAYAVYPESVKGLYATLCARSPRFGRSMESLLDANELPCVSPARTLGAAGYRTALFHSGRFGYLGMDRLVADLGFAHLEDAGAISGRVQSSFGVDEASTMARTLAWIDRGPAASPFFAVYMPAAGHHPYASNVAGIFDGDDEMSRYRNALHETDVALDTLLGGLASRDLLDRTMIIVLGDHGEAFGQHPGNAGHTLFIHDENVRVPYVIRIPGVTSPGSRVGAPASVLDTAPTLLDLMGLSVPNGTEGQSLLAPGSRVAPFFADYSLGWVGLRDGCWKYQFNMNAAQSHLFDVCRDPGETTNRAAEQPERVATYRRTLDNWK